MYKMQLYSWFYTIYMMMRVPSYLTGVVMMKEFLTCTAVVAETVIVRHALVALESADSRLAVALATDDVARAVVRPD